MSDKKTPGIKPGTNIFKRKNGFYEVITLGGITFGVGPDMPKFYAEAKAYAEANPKLLAAHPDDEPKTATRREAMARLAELDAVVSRSVEDLYNATKATPHTKTKAAMDEKAAIRATL